MARKLLGKISRMIEMNDGERIGSGFNVRPAPYLPIIEFDSENDIGIVMKKGTIVTFDSNGYLIPCTGGSALVTLTYTALDVTYEVYDLDTMNSTPAALTATKTTTAKLVANYPVGVLQYDVQQYQPDNHYYYHIQDHVAILEDKLVLFALDATRAGAHTWTPGVTVIPDAYGHPIPLTADTFEDIATDIKEVQTFTVATGATDSGNITVGGVAVAVVSANSTADVATLIRAGSYTGWTVTGSASTAIFTSTTYGPKAALTFVDTGVTGVTGAFVETTEGSYGSTDAVAFAVSSLNFKVGKVIRVIDLTKDVDKNFLGGYEAVIVPTGYNLPGQETGGIGAGIDATSKKGVLIQLQF